MGTSLYERYQAEQAAPATGSLYDQYKATQPKGRDYHAEFKSGALQRGIARANQGDQEVAAAEDQANAPTVSGALANLAHEIPGAEALQAGARSAVRGQSYGDAYKDIEQARDNLPMSAKIITGIAGAAPLAAVLPGGPVMSGALYGGAEQALSADPNRGLGERALRTAGGAAAGAVLGKAAEGITTAGRALLSSKTSTNLLAKEVARAKSAKQLYGAAMQEGQGKAATQAVQKYVQEPDVAEIVTELQQTTHKGVAAESPEMLDAIYKTLSDRAATIKKGLESVSPNRVNIGGFRKEHVENLRKGLLDAMSEKGTQTTVTDVPAITTAQSPMKSLRESLDAFRGRSAEAARRATGGAQPNTNPFSSHASGETFAQRQAREMLERGGAESVVSPSLRGAPGPKTITETVDIPAVMPSYKTAVADFAARSREMEAVRKGSDALRAKLSGGIPSGKNMTRTTPEAFAQWAEKNAGDVPAATEGILGTTRMALTGNPTGAGRRALAAAPSLLRNGGNRQQQLIDIILKAGLLGGRTSIDR